MANRFIQIDATLNVQFVDGDTNYTPIACDSEDDVQAAIDHESSKWGSFPHWEAGSYTITRGE